MTPAAPPPDKRGLLDTSVVIALATGTTLAVPDESSISVITLCELHHGVLAARGKTQAARLATLAAVERTFEVRPVDARVAPHFGQLIAQARRKGARPATADLLIAATAISHALPFYARDRDFERLDIPALRLV